MNEFTEMSKNSRKIPSTAQFDYRFSDKIHLLSASLTGHYQSAVHMYDPVRVACHVDATSSYMLNFFLFFGDSSVDN